MCSFDKFGFCKFKEGCKKAHFAQICQDLSGCKDITQCEKRHPKNCKKYSSVNGCRHGEKCANNHNVTKHDGERIISKDKVEILEKKVVDMARKESSRLEKLEIVVKALRRKVLSLENELEEIKKIRGH